MNPDARRKGRAPGVRTPDRWTVGSRRMRTRAAVALLVPAFVAGCGGGLSKSELVAKGDAICARVNKQIAKEPDPKTAADLERLARRTAQISGPAIDDMEALEPPGELEDD